jgi:hypothetical protein
VHVFESSNLWQLASSQDEMAHLMSQLQDCRERASATEAAAEQVKAANTQLRTDAEAAKAETATLSQALLAAREEHAASLAGQETACAEQGPAEARRAEVECGERARLRSDAETVCEAEAEARGEVAAARAASEQLRGALAALRSECDAERAACAAAQEAAAREAAAQEAAERRPRGAPRPPQALGPLLAVLVLVGYWRLRARGLNSQGRLVAAAAEAAAPAVMACAAVMAVAAAQVAFWLPRLTAHGVRAMGQLRHALGRLLARTRARLAARGKAATPTTEPSVRMR